MSKVKAKITELYNDRSWIIMYVCLVKYQNVTLQPSAYIVP